MKVTSYLTVDGEVLAETRDGVDRDYLPDPLGSTAALLDAGQNKTDAFAFWPYGEERTRTGTTATPFRYVGTLGYYADQPNQRTYVRARVLRPDLARWQTADPLWPNENAYGYARCGPMSWIDPAGLDGWRPPHEPDEDRKFPNCKGRQPMSLGWWDVNPDNPGLDLCVACLAYYRVHDKALAGADNGYPGGNDKGGHFIAGCLARIQCGSVCSKKIGSQFEYYQDTRNRLHGEHGDVSAGDALAVEDGWDAGAGFDGGSPGAQYLMNSPRLFCLRAAERSKWWRGRVKRR